MIKQILAELDHNIRLRYGPIGMRFGISSRSKLPGVRTLYRDTPCSTQLMATDLSGVPRSIGHHVKAALNRLCGNATPPTT